MIFKSSLWEEYFLDHLDPTSELLLQAFYVGICLLDNELRPGHLNLYVVIRNLWNVFWLTHKPQFWLSLALNCWTFWKEIALCARLLSLWWLILISVNPLTKFVIITFDNLKINLFFWIYRLILSSLKFCFLCFRLWMMWNLLSTGSNVEKDQLFCSRYSQALKKFLIQVLKVST